MMLNMHLNEIYVFKQWYIYIYTHIYDEDNFWLISMGVSNLPNDPKRDDQPMCWRIRPFLISTTHRPRAFMGLTWGPLTHPYMDINCTSRPKTLPCNHISCIWKGDPEYLGSFSLQGNSLIPRDLGQLSITI